MRCANTQISWCAAPARPLRSARISAPDAQIRSSGYRLHLCSDSSSRPILTIALPPWQCVGRGRAELRTACQRSLVSLHFQLLLLQHFVALNFTAVTKMLKKFEKKLQVPLRNDYIGALVELPFYRCEALGELVEETERQFAMLEQRASTAAATCGAEPPQANPPSQQRSQPQPASACMPPPPPVGAAAIPACAKAPVAV